MSDRGPLNDEQRAVLNVLYPPNGMTSICVRSALNSAITELADLISDYDDQLAKGGRAVRPDRRTAVQKARDDAASTLRLYLDCFGRLPEQFQPDHPLMRRAREEAP